jgi:hypothetical protein
MSLYHRFHDRFGAAGVVIAVIALVMAMVTGAYAAGGGLNGKQKKEVKKIAKTEAKKYANSNPGTPGTPGKDGTNGTNGKDGTNGANGKSVEISATAAGCAEGGASVQVEGEPSTVQEVCNGLEGEKGEEGSPWTAGGTLPSKSTETGIWGTKLTSAAEKIVMSLSFPIPLPASLDAEHVHYINQAGKEVLESGEEKTSTVCLGSPSAPTATAGNLCIYAGTEFNAEVIKNSSIANPAENLLTGPPPGAATSGAMLSVDLKTFGIATGTFAVTAP